MRSNSDVITKPVNARQSLEWHDFETNQSTKHAVTNNYVNIVVLRSTDHFNIHSEQSGGVPSWWNCWQKAQEASLIQVQSSQ